jgi:hypothetical protein
MKTRTCIIAKPERFWQCGSERAASNSITHGRKSEIYGTELALMALASPICPHTTRDVPSTLLANPPKSM